MNKDIPLKNYYIEGEEMDIELEIACLFVDYLDKEGKEKTLEKLKIVEKQVIKSLGKKIKNNEIDKFCRGLTKKRYN